MGGGGEFGSVSSPDLGFMELMTLGIVGIFIYTKFDGLYWHIHPHITELSANQGLVCSRNDNSDVLKLLYFEL